MIKDFYGIDDYLEDISDVLALANECSTLAQLAKEISLLASKWMTDACDCSIQASEAIEPDDRLYFNTLSDICNQHSVTLYEFEWATVEDIFTPVLKGRELPYFPYKLEHAKKLVSRKYQD